MSVGQYDKEGSDQLDQIRDILLRKEREDVNELRLILENQVKLGQKVNPIIEQHIHFLKENFPEEYRIEIDKQIEQKLKSSQEELLAVIAPMMGKMVKKYISEQFQILREQIEYQLRSSTRSGIFGWFRRLFSNVSESEWVLSQVSGPVIEDIYVIERDSGILLGSATGASTMDLDMVAGMLTAIKSFAEDAFSRKDESLEMVEYGNHRIMLQNFSTYYVAMAITGTFTAKDRQRLGEELIVFCEKELDPFIQEVDNSTNLNVRKKLESFFLLPQKDAKRKQIKQ